MWRFKLWLWRLEGLQPYLWWLNQKLLGRPGYAVCDGCRWVFPISELTGGLCPGCDARHALEECDRQIQEGQIQEEIDRAWRERRAELESEPCTFCGHPLSEHAGPDCMVTGCFCTEEYFDELAREESEPSREVWFTEPPGGHRGWE